MMLVLFALAPLSYGLNSNRLNEADIQEGATRSSRSRRSPRSLRATR